MKIEVVFENWNNNIRTIIVTDDMCEALLDCRYDIDKMILAYKYVERRYTEMIRLISLKIIEN